MMRSMYSGISGLRAHQISMDVIGNNIANVNTVGFKSSRTTFQEIYNQTLQNATAPSEDEQRGGRNPMQVGLGISVGSIDVMHTRGSVQRTDRSLDLAIDGDGFFVVSDGTSDYYTRAGNFDIDKLGNLVTASGLNVMGWSDKILDKQTGEQVIDASGIPSSINLSNLSMQAKQTDKIKFEGNLDNSYNDGDSIQYGVSVYDSQGYEHKVNYVFTKHASNVWKFKIVPAADENKDITYERDLTPGVTPAKTGIAFTGATADAKKPIQYSHDISSISIDDGSGIRQYSYRVVNTEQDFIDATSTLSSGQAVVYANGNEDVRVAFGDDLGATDRIVIDYNDDPISHVSPMVDSYDDFDGDLSVPDTDTALSPLPGSAVGYDTDGDSIDDVVDGEAHGVVIFGKDGKLENVLMNSDISIVMNSDATGADNIILSRDNIQFDTTKFTQYTGDTTIKTSEVTGYAAGTLDSISIDTAGQIIGIYSNGQARIDAILATSRFSNPSGLLKMGDNLFMNSSNSGAAIVGQAGVDGRGPINPGSLEMSNVDLAKEFTEMIVAQRGFQANSRIITTSDELLQELVNLKR